jgi:outer membrane immunogenic protein
VNARPKRFGKIRSGKTLETVMKKFLLGTVGLIALGVASAPASAADLAARPYTKAPPMIAAIYDWSGFYIGANGGWGSSHNCWDNTTPAGAFFAAEGCHDATGGVAGGQVGYRWQNAGWVFGLEAQGDWADLGLFTGQIGYAWNNALLYVKGGGAVTDNRNDILAVGGGPLIASTGDQTRWGGTVGVGIEFGFAPNWSAGLEYDHLFMQDKNVAFTTPGGFAFGTDNVRQDVDLVTVRVNYRWGGPMINKY